MLRRATCISLASAFAIARSASAVPLATSMVSRGTFAQTLTVAGAIPKRAMALRGGSAKEGDAVPEVTFKCRVRDEKVREDIGL